MRILYIVMQIVALFWLVMDSLRLSIDPNTGSHMIQHPLICKITAYVQYWPPTIFYGCYLFQILLRLDTSFAGSYLALKQRTVYTLGVAVIVVPVASLSCLVIDDWNLECVQSWNPMDIDKAITYCTVPSTSLLIFRYHIIAGYVVMVNLLNITFAVIFAVKLRVFLTDASSPRNRDRFKFKVCSLEYD